MSLSRYRHISDIGIIIKRDIEICYEPQHVFFVRTQPVQQTSWFSLRNTATSFPMNTGRGLNITGREDHAVFTPDSLERFFPKTGVSAGFRRLNFPMHADQEILHRAERMCAGAPNPARHRTRQISAARLTPRLPHAL